MMDIKKELNEIFDIQEDYNKYMDLCKRKYSKFPMQYKKCRDAVIKRFGNG